MVASSALADHISINVSGNIVAPKQPANFMVNASPQDVVNYARQGNNLVIEMTSGQTFTIQSFFEEGASFHNLVLVQGPAPIVVDLSSVAASTSVTSLLGILGLAGVGGAVATAAMNGNHDETPTVDTAAPTQTASITTVADDVTPQSGTVASGGWTNDTTPALSGTLSAGLGSGETLEVLRDGAVIGTATVSGTDWSYADSRLSDGASYSYTVRVKDAAGNTGTPSSAYVINVDIAAPVQTASITAITDDVAAYTGTVSNGAATNDPAPELSGTLLAALASGETLEVLRDGVIIGTATVSGTDWSYADSGLSDGQTYSYTVHVRDAAGNAGTASAAYTLTVDTAAPAQVVSITAVADDVAPQSGTVASGGATNDTAPELAGTLSAGLGDGEILQVLRNGVVIGVATVSDTDWNYADSGLSDGQSYNYTVRVQNAAGNTGTASATYTLTVDTAAPAQVASITAVADDIAPQTGTVASGGATNDTAPELSGMLSAGLGDGETLEVLRDGVVIGTATVSGTDWSYADSGLLGGASYSYTVHVKDMAGNIGTPSSAYVINVDTVAPTQTVSITAVADGVEPQTGTVASGGMTNDTAPELSGTLSADLGDGEILEVLRNGVVIGTATVNNTDWSYADSGLLDGASYSYTVRVKDAAGNTGTASSAHVINVDTTAPTQTVSITAVTDGVEPQTGTVSSSGTTNDTAPELAGTLSADLASGEILEVLRDGAVIGTATVNDTDWSYADSGLLDGQSYSYTVHVKDAAGNTGTASSAYVINMDTAAPTQTVSITAVTDDIAPQAGTVASGGTTNDTAPELSGTLSAGLGDGEILEVLRDGVVIGTATVSGTDWSYADSGLLDGASYSYTVHVKDAAGNTGTASSAYVIDVDTAAPIQTASITAVADDVPPQAGTVSSGGATNDTAPELAGTLSAGLASGEILEVLRDGAVIGTATVNDTDWSYADSGLLDGQSYSYTVRVKDAAGNMGTASSAYVIDVDTAVPTQTISITAVTDDIAPQTGTVSSGGTTNDTAPTLSGTLSAGLGDGETLEVLRDGVVIGTATVSGTDWSYADSRLSDGASYSYTVHVKDAAGNTGTASSAYVIDVDTAAPIQTVSYTVRVKDAAGNMGTASSAYVIDVDTAVPTQTISITAVTDDIAPQTGTVSSGGTTNDTAPTLSGTLSAGLGDGETLEVLRDGVVIGTATVNDTDWSYADSGLLDGASYSYTVHVKDVRLDAKRVSVG